MIGDVGRIAHGCQRNVVAAALLIVDDCVAVEERAAARILADEAQVVAVVDQRGVGEVLGEAPVHRLLAGGHLRAVVVDLGDARMRGDAGRQHDDLAVELGELFARDAGLDRFAEIRVQMPGPVDRELVPEIGIEARDRRAFLELLAIGVDQRLRVGFADHAFGGELLAVELARGRARADDLIHQRLRRGRLVGLVVAVAAIADEIDDDVALELLAEIERERARQRAPPRDRRRSRGTPAR